VRERKRRRKEGEIGSEEEYREGMQREEVVKKERRESRERQKRLGGSERCGRVGASRIRTE
jgi:hypothetical protein